ncbi:MAG TPA: M64 family metallopeptidase, partial [Planctomycetota bacterium]|nr:M64 family metallopeptidase [Planctomycetota bacterium]
MKRPAILIGMSMVCWALIIGTVLAADEAAQKRREKWLERQQELNKHGILKLETVISTGDPSNRLDVVILGDGFYKNTMDRFQAASDRLAKGFLGLMPYDNFANYINVHRLYLESPKGDFALDSEVTGEGLMRILNCDRAKAESLAELAPDCDLVVVLCNTPRSGRANATGKVVLLWGKSGSSILTVHEFGHAFAGLADEYEEADP